MKCHIAKDLLPNYIDDLNSEETNAELKKHLADCVDCRAVYEKMTTEIIREMQPEDSNIDFLKKLKVAMLCKNVIVAIKTCLIVLVCVGGLFAYVFYYEIPVLYDEERTKVEVAKIAVLETEDEDGELWQSWRELGDDELEEGEIVRDELNLATYNLPHYQKHVYGRNINRDGEQIRVIYYCYTQTPFIRFVYKYMFYDYKSTGNYYGSALHGEEFEPKMIEVYYLPNLFKFYKTIEKISDEEYDAKRTNGTLVWSGVI